MVDQNDPRLETDNSFLAQFHWKWKKWSQTRENWDHDHCEFCGAKFMNANGPNILHEGYATPDDYYWICSNCFNDFKQLYNWQME